MKRYTRDLITITFIAAVSILTPAFSPAGAANYSIFADPDCPQCQFAAEEIKAALASKKHRFSQSDLAKFVEPVTEFNIVLSITPEKLKTAQKPAKILKPEGFSIRTTKSGDKTTYWVTSYDSAGLMYGGMELAEMIETGNDRQPINIDQNPYMQMRGTKFNCPLDARSPSYTDPCDAAQKNIPEMWNFEFWKEYIDNLARYRYNYISLWSLHPFPSLVKVPGYEDVALDDVQRSTVQWKENYNLNGIGFDSPEILNNCEIIKKMTIEEKIAFWRKVMAYGKQRNVDFYFVTWNIFVNGTYGKYGITDSIENETTTDYFRRSVKQMFVTYPDLAGIGLTTGENMHGANFKQKEDWAFETYAQGMLDAAKLQPNRKFRFIHRQHQAGAQEIAKRFKLLIDHPNIDFIFSFKYAKAHVYSSTTQPYHRDFVKDIGDLKTIWTLRNDDIYRFRWGSPAFVREFIKNIPYDVSQGYYYGSDQYIWGREFMSLEPETPRRIEIVKHWYHWMIWGRLGYNPDMTDERFTGILQARFPDVHAPTLFDAWANVSMIYPLTTGFHWGALDFQWYIEACKSRSGPAQTKTGFHDINRFITLPPHATTGYMSIPDYVKALKSDKKIDKTTPIQVSEMIHKHADTALEKLKSISAGNNKELRQTLTDIETVAYLGKYYAHKIRAATELALYRDNGKQVHRDAAADNMNRAAEYWRLYSSMAISQYTDNLWTNRVGYCNWKKLFLEVLDDIKIAGGKVDLKSEKSTAAGSVLQAEYAVYEGPLKMDGLLDFSAAKAGSFIEWSYNAPADGTYLIELRYTIDRGEYPAKIIINGKDAGQIILWTTGGEDVWAWDRKPVPLKLGRNTIRIIPTGGPQIDYLKIIN